jgi:hypothetical protein
MEVDLMSLVQVFVSLAVLLPHLVTEFESQAQSVKYCLSFVFFVYLMTLSIAETTTPINEKVKVNNELGSCEREQSWPNLT